MKRFFFSLIALSAAAVGCTQSAMLETPENFNQEVSFSPYTGRTPVTKASTIAQPDAEGIMPEGAITLADDGGFNVFGFLTNEDGKTTILDAMNNEHVFMGANGWTYDGLVYWPDKASKSTMSFVAYSNNAVDYITWKGNQTRTEQVLTFTVPDDIDAQVDFLATAFQEGLSLNHTSSADGTVSLNFHHLLSRVGFKVQTTTTTGVKIKALSLTGRMHVSGELNLKTVKGTEVPVLNAVNNKANPEYHYIKADEESSEVSEAKENAQRISRDGSEYLMILPHIIRQGDDHLIKVTYQVGDGKDRNTFVELPTDFEFKPGKAYEFILKISTSSISFKVEENGWNNVSESGTTYPIEPAPQESIILGVANSITGNSAIVPITINEEDFDEVGIDFKKNSESEWDTVNNRITLQKNNNKYPFEVTIQGLESHTKYDYRAYSKSGDEIIYYPDNNYPTFTTKAVVNLTINGYTTGTASVTGVCTDSGITEYGFCWSKGSVSPSVLDNTISVSATNGSFNYTIPGLDSYTVYYCCAYVKDAEGNIYYSSVKDFRTEFAVEEGNNTNSNVGDNGGIDFSTPNEN